MSLFRNRFEAGEVLASALRRFHHVPGLLVLGIPRGGMPVAYEVARRLGAPLESYVVAKLRSEENEAITLGAVAGDGTCLLNTGLIHGCRIPDGFLGQEIIRRRKEISFRESLYRGGTEFPELSGRVVIVVDDGVLSGASLIVALRALRRHDPVYLVVAVPGAGSWICQELRKLADEVVCPFPSEVFDGVDGWYRHNSRLTDNGVRELLKLRRVEFAMSARPSITRLYEDLVAQRCHQS